MLVWIAQAFVVASTAANLTERLTRRLLPLATLLGMTLTFPDQAPSRFGMALRTGTVTDCANSRTQGPTVWAERRPAPLRKLSSWSPSWVITNV